MVQNVLNFFHSGCLLCSSVALNGQQDFIRILVGRRADVDRIVVSAEVGICDICRGRPIRSVLRFRRIVQLLKYCIPCHGLLSVALGFGGSVSRSHLFCLRFCAWSKSVPVKILLMDNLSSFGGRGSEAFLHATYSSPRRFCGTNATNPGALIGISSMVQISCKKWLAVAPRRRPRARPPIVTGGTDQPGIGDNFTSDDEQLYRELREKVRELYGGRENVAIDAMDSDELVEFKVRTAPDGSNVSAYRAAWFTVGSIIAAVVISVGVFAVMVKVGAVHDASLKRREYDMPSYRNRSYVQPMDFLQEDLPIIK